MLVSRRIRPSLSPLSPCRSHSLYFHNTTSRRLSLARRPLVLLRRRVPRQIRPEAPRPCDVFGHARGFLQAVGDLGYSSLMLFVSMYIPGPWIALRQTDNLLALCVDRDMHAAMNKSHEVNYSSLVKYTASMIPQY
jgi:hypothetical protein